MHCSKSYYEIDGKILINNPLFGHLLDWCENNLSSESWKIVKTQVNLTFNKDLINTNVYEIHIEFLSEEDFIFYKMVFSNDSL